MVLLGMWGQESDEFFLWHNGDYQAFFRFNKFSIQALLDFRKKIIYHQDSCSLFRFQNLLTSPSSELGQPFLSWNKTDYSLLNCKPKLRHGQNILGIWGTAKNALHQNFWCIGVCPIWENCLSNYNLLFHACFYQRFNIKKSLDDFWCRDGTGDQITQPDSSVGGRNLSNFNSFFEEEGCEL